MELRNCSRLYVTECISHSPVYLPKQACNAATPSRLLLLAPGHAEWRSFGAFFALFLLHLLLLWVCCEESIQNLACLLFALPFQRREMLHRCAYPNLAPHFEQRVGCLTPL